MTDPVALYDTPCGIEGKVYVGVAGTTPTDVLAQEQKVEHSIKNTTAKWSTRGRKKKTSKVTTSEDTLTMTVVKNNLSDEFLLLQAARAGTEIALKAIDKTSGYGVDADWVISEWKESQESDNPDSIDVTLELSQLYRAPTYNVPA